MEADKERFTDIEKEERFIIFEASRIDTFQRDVAFEVAALRKTNSSAFARVLEIGGVLLVLDKFFWAETDKIVKRLDEHFYEILFGEEIKNPGQKNLKEVVDLAVQTFESFDATIPPLTPEAKSLLSDYCISRTLFILEKKS